MLNHLPTYEMTLGFKPFTVTDAQVDLELKGKLQSDGCFLDPEKYDPVKFLGSGGYTQVKGTNTVCIENIEAFLRGFMHVLCLNFKTHCFMYWRGGLFAVGILLLYLGFSLSQIQPIFVSFVAISSVLGRFLKAMLLVWLLP